MSLYVMLRVTVLLYGEPPYYCTENPQNPTDRVRRTPMVTVHPEVHRNKTNAKAPLHNPHVLGQACVSDSNVLQSLRSLTRLHGASNLSLHTIKIHF